MQAAAICERMGWTYDEYLDQPIPFLNALITFFKAENEAMKRSKVE
jgi:hypothetical protein